MTKVPVWINPIADALLERFRIWKTTVDPPIPNQLVVQRDLENASGPGRQGHLGEIAAKGRQQFLRHPSRP